MDTFTRRVLHCLFSIVSLLAISLFLSLALSYVVFLCHAKYSKFINLNCCMLCMQVTAWKKDLMSFYVFSTGYNFPSIKTDNGTIIQFGSERAIRLLREGRLISQTITKTTGSGMLISR